MQKHNRQAQRFGCNSVPRIITPPLFGNLRELRLLDDLNTTDARLCRHELH
jgi:hypothetical protein